MTARVLVPRLKKKASEGSRLLWLAVQKAGSQSTVATVIGIDRGTMNRWLRAGHKPNTKYRSLLQAQYGIPLLSWDEPSSKPHTHLSLSAA